MKKKSPTATVQPDFSSWKRRQLWTVFEACCLISSVEPPPAVPSHVLKERLALLPTDELREQVGRIYGDAKQSFDLGTLKWVRSTTLSAKSPHAQHRQVKPLEFLNWANERGHPIPSGLGFASEEKPLTNKERDNLNRIIAMLIEASVKKEASLKKPQIYKSESDLIAWIAQQGIGIPGLGERNLQTVFAKAKQVLNNTR